MTVSDAAANAVLVFLQGCNGPVSFSAISASPVVMGENGIEDTMAIHECLEVLRAEGLAEFTTKGWKVTDKECGLDVDAVVRLVKLDAGKELELSGKDGGQAPHVCDQGVDYPCYLKSLATRRDLEPCPCGKDDDKCEDVFPASLFSKDDMLESLIEDEDKRELAMKQSLSCIVKMMNQGDRTYMFRPHLRVLADTIGHCLCALEFFAAESCCATEGIEAGYNAARKDFNDIMTEGKV